MSTNYIFIIKKNNLRKALPIKQIKGLTKSLLPNNQELVIHMSEDPDVLLRAKNRDELIDQIKKQHCYVEMGNLAIYAVNKK